MGAGQRRCALIVFIGLLLSSPYTSAAPRSGGGFRSSFFGRSSSRPAAAPVTAAAPASTYGARTFGGTTPFSYSRPGFRATPFILPFAAGALTASALYSLNNDRNAYCDGSRVQCYKTTCQNALSQCQDTNSTQLVNAPCPDPRFSECWQSTDQVFQCFGTRRPRFGNDDVAAYCNQAVSSSAAGSIRMKMVLMVSLMLVAVLLL